MPSRQSSCLYSLSLLLETQLIFRFCQFFFLIFYICLERSQAFSNLCSSPTHFSLRNSKEQRETSAQEYLNIYPLTHPSTHPSLHPSIHSPIHSTSSMCKAFCLVRSKKAKLFLFFKRDLNLKGRLKQSGNKRKMELIHINVRYEFIRS